MGKRKKDPVDQSLEFFAASRFRDKSRKEALTENIFGKGIYFELSYKLICCEL